MTHPVIKNFRRLLNYSLIIVFMCACNRHSFKGTSGMVAISSKWEMPFQLKEISGISWIGQDRFACIQDEEGRIFIYNTSTRKIEKEVYFAPPADFEGIAVVGPTAYILHTSGKIFELKRYRSANPSLIIYETFPPGKQNFEGLCYDRKNRRLLMAVKNNDPSGSSEKNIYAFDISTHKLVDSPIYTIGHGNEILKNESMMQPSDLAVHPRSGDIYILDGERPRLLIMSADGKFKKLFHLDGPSFPLPEGISFNRRGEMFICNEAGSGVGNILQVKDVIQDSLTPSSR